MNPYTVLGLVVAWGASVGGAFFYGQGVGADGVIAKQQAVDQAIQQTRDAAQQGAAAAIALLKPRNVTIRQETEREIQTNTVYRDCRVPADGVRLANEAITGRPAEPAGGGSVPGPRSPD